VPPHARNPRQKKKRTAYAVRFFYSPRLPQSFCPTMLSR
jgi:hypothetical protein